MQTQTRARKLKTTSILIDPTDADELRRIALMKSLTSGVPTTSSAIIRTLIGDYLTQQRTVQCQRA
jgi:hypothetical protein